MNFDDLNVVPHLLMMYTGLAGHLSMYHYQLPRRMHSCSWEVYNPRMAWRIYMQYADRSEYKQRIPTFSIHVDIISPSIPSYLLLSQRIETDTDEASKPGSRSSVVHTGFWIEARGVDGKQVRHRTALLCQY